MLEPTPLDIDLLADYKETLIEMAGDRLIRELRISGGHVTEPFVCVPQIIFMIIPEEGMTVWHTRTFEKMASFLLKKSVNVFTSEELPHEPEKSVNLEEFIEKHVPSPQSPETRKIIDATLALLKSDERIWQDILKHPSVIKQVGNRLYLSFLAQRKTSILMLAKDFGIQDVKIFGKCLEQKFYSPVELTFLIIPNGKITDRQQKAFEKALSTLIKKKLNVFNTHELEERIEYALATEEQVNSYIEKATSVENLKVIDGAPPLQEREKISPQSNSPTFGKK